MNTVEYIREKNRLCQSFKCDGCETCPLYDGKCEIHNDLTDDDILKAIEVVDQWSSSHSVVTNRQKFREIFGIDIDLSSQYPGGYFYLKSPEFDTGDSTLAWLSSEYVAAGTAD